MLKSNDYIQNMCDNISKVLDLEVTLVDKSLRRIAGTGSYFSKIGEIIDENSIYSEVLKTGKCSIMHEKELNDKCKICKRKTLCEEMADVCAPIKNGNKVIGVIGLVAFNNEQRESIISKKEELMNFIETIAKLLYVQMNEEETEVKTFEELEKNEIQKALKKYGTTTEGMKKAADALNIGIATLYRKVKKYDIK
ncbi:regulatory protein, Fis family [Alkalithermobacter thermoalcaliphilus JW-YL-7 = DSM 7308]|uniref:Regulatory protein, Fis family n=1 Tax=Alkalithermobacter thermoalcaliphilus JW-YL-7 = DSM 7308 TaxID=1121328 RepID=A0A150FSB5_CLOPD|nr:transcriptional regulator, Fis family [[Clostridium] paradoxum JW-YL-7 = DSM 7308]SHK73012.1 regulatory protein, Fis family [[Clostridium] paradoxum JW-YL-7 = DSM 7308]